MSNYRSTPFFLFSRLSLGRSVVALFLLLLSLLSLALPSWAQPAAPTSLVATGSEPSPGVGRITITWNASTGASSYRLYKRASGSSFNYTNPPFATVTATTASSYNVIDTDLVAGTRYGYVVRAVNGSLVSANSNEDSATFLPTITNLTATPGSSQVSLDWPDVTGASSYQLYRSTTPGTLGTEVSPYPTVSEYINTGRTNGTAYYYTVRSRNTAGTSADSNQVGAIPTTGTPSAPTSLVATGSEPSLGVGKITITWNGLGNTGSTGATSYYLYKRAAGSSFNYTNPPFATVTATSATSYSVTDTSIVAGTRYGYVVRAVNGTLISAISNEDSATFLPRITSLAVTAEGNGYVSLDWPDVTGATSYQVYRSTTSSNVGSVVSPAPTASNYTNTGLTNGTTYYYRVVSVNAAGSSAASYPVAAYPYSGSPAAPTNLSATPGDRWVVLNWVGSAKSFQLYRSTSSASLGVALNPTADNSFVDTGLTNGTQYFYRVYGVNQAGTSASSNQASAIPLSSYGSGGGGDYVSFGSGDLFVGLSTGNVQIYDTSNPSTASYKGTLVDDNSSPPANGMTFNQNGDLLVAKTTAGVKSFSASNNAVGVFVAPTSATNNPTSVSTFANSKWLHGAPNTDFGQIFRLGQATGPVLNASTAGVGIEVNETPPTSTSTWAVADATGDHTYFTSTEVGINGPVVKRYRNIQKLSSIYLDPTYSANAFAILPGGGILIAAGDKILAFNDNGNPINSYDVPGVNNWYSLTLGKDIDPEHKIEDNQLDYYFYASGANSSSVYKFLLTAAPGESSGYQYLTIPGQQITGLTVKDCETASAYPHFPEFTDQGAAIEVPVGTQASFDIYYGDRDFADAVTVTKSGPGTLSNVESGHSTYSLTPTTVGLQYITVYLTDIDGHVSSRQYLVNAYSGTRDVPQFQPVGETEINQNFTVTASYPPPTGTEVPKDVTLDRILTFDNVRQTGDSVGQVGLSTSSPLPITSQVSATIDTQPTYTTPPDAYYHPYFCVAYYIAKGPTGNITVTKRIYRPAYYSYP